MAAAADVFAERDTWGRDVAVSFAAHVALFGGMLLYAYIAGGTHGENWGGAGGGGAMSVNLTSAIPLAPREAPAENIVANESEGLSQSVPKPPEKAPDAIPIPERDAKKTAKGVTPTTTKAPDRPVKQAEPPAQNVVPFGQGGPVAGAYSVSTPTGGGGLTFSGDGAFGSRYGWYVDAVRRKVAENWYKYEVGAGLESAKRVYITFEISRDGRPNNIQVSQSSGVPALDISARRALERIDTFGPLPPDYHGSKVNVEFYFDYKR
jgi:periplasmic protein TonB